jgi:hypothetical protein
MLLLVLAPLAFLLLADPPAATTATAACVSPFK